MGVLSAVSVFLGAMLISKAHLEDVSQATRPRDRGLRFLHAPHSNISSVLLCRHLLLIHSTSIGKFRGPVLREGQPVGPAWLQDARRYDAEVLSHR